MADEANYEESRGTGRRVIITVPDNCVTVNNDVKVNCNRMVNLNHDYNKEDTNYHVISVAIDIYHFSYFNIYHDSVEIYIIDPNLYAITNVDCNVSD